MKILQSSFFRALTAMAVGALLIVYPDNTVTGIVITIGVLFALSGLISVLSYLNARKHFADYTVYDANGRIVAGQMPMFPIVGIGSMVLGAILALMPATFINALMYIIGTVLIIGAIGQYVSIISVRRYGIASLGYWLCPTLILLAGIYIMIYPMSPLSLTMQILGVLTLAYGVVEAVNSLLFYAGKRRWEKAVQAMENEMTVNEPADIATPESTMAEDAPTTEKTSATVQ